ncbi:MAG: hypothetical protein HY850_08350 [Betaproteobacteria bacterium]|nr:hypothetical protein [Betaproteobacteria bacterium]
MTKTTAPVQALLAGLIAAFTLLPLAAQAAKTETTSQPSQQTKEPEKDKDSDDDKKPKVSVAITGPLPGTVVTAPADIALTVDAQSSQKNKPIRWVAYFQGKTLIGIATQAPFSLTWRQVPAGTYSLTAIASNNKLEEDDRRKLEGKGDKEDKRSKDDNDDSKGKDGKGYKLNPEHDARSAPVEIIVNAPPTVVVTAPAANTVVTAPASIALEADAADSDGQIAQVAFYQGGVLLGTASQAPYAITWADAPAGSYSLTAVATDNHGAATTSAPVPIIVNAPPTVVLTSPADRAVLAAPTDLVLTADAADSDGSIAKVEFYQGGVLLGSATQAPYSFTLPNAAPGAYSLTAVATDNYGASAVSAAITATADIPPTVRLAATPVDDLIAPATLSLTADAADSDGSIAKVAFYQGDVLLGSVSQTPYAFTWDKVMPGSYSLTAIATDNLGISTVSTAVPVTVVPNQPPQVALTSPQQADQPFVAPATVKLAADASDADGKVTKVAFYQDGNLLGTASQAPYVYDWSNVPVGSYAITAQATDNKGGVTVSPPLNVTVLAQMKGVFYIHPDHLGMPRIVTDDKNKVVWKNDPLGEPFGAGAADEDADGDRVKFALNLRFPGQYYDQETGAHYNYYRDNYLPDLGRYGQSDPVGLAGGLNAYAYVNSNSLTYADPLGLDKTIWWPPGPGRTILDGPRNGNWGGGNLSGGITGGHTGNASPLDSADACYMRHDQCFDSGESKKSCNTKLVSELQSLPDDPRKWPMPPKPGTERDTKQFLRGAILIFGQ